jgi:hypothetical protein
MQCCGACSSYTVAFDAATMPRHTDSCLWHNSRCNECCIPVQPRCISSQKWHMEIYLIMPCGTICSGVISHDLACCLEHNTMVCPAGHPVQSSASDEPTATEKVPLTESALWHQLCIVPLSCYVWHTDFCLCLNGM